MPNTEHFDRLFLFSAAGLGLLLAGALNLALGGKGRRVWLRAAATVAACVAVAAGLAYFTRPELALRAAGLMFGVLLAATAFGSGWAHRRVAALAAFFRRPAPRWGLVATCGLAVVIGSGVAFDRADEAAIEQSMRDLDMEVGRAPSRPASSSRATTDRGTPVALKEPIEARSVSELLEPEEKTLRASPFRDQLIRRAAATDVSNCHGWVFTGGQFILGPEDVELILKENGYRETQEPQPGDVVIYRQGAQIAHTAVVRYVAEGQPVLVEGKWGVMGVYLHPADKSCYGTDYTFHRSARTGHLLTGLGGTSPATPAAPMTSE